MDLKKLIYRGKQFGGLRLFMAYLRLGVGKILFGQLLKVVRGKATQNEAYAEIRKKVNQKLQARYADFLKARKDYYDRQSLEQVHSKKVWTCWLQGFDAAPELVKVCQTSLKKYLVDREIIQLTEENYKSYVTLPDYIINRYDKGQIPPALFSDLLRLEVLIRYGGTWMDASVLCTGDGYPRELLDCDLFMFQALRKGDRRFYGTSNWFITACSGNRLLMVLRDVLYEYWKDYSCTLNYYMFHDFFYKIGAMYPQEIEAMPRRNRRIPLMLMERMGDTYDQPWMEELLKHCWFHKLCWRVRDAAISNPDSFYHHIIEVSQAQL